MRFFFIFILGSIACFAQDESGRSEIAEENRAINSIGLQFTIYSHTHPDTPITNLVQVLEDVFREFGTNNWTLESYVFMPPGMTVKDSIGGEVVLMSAQPFGSPGEMNRAIVAKLPDRYRGFIESERRVQRMLAEAGVEVPKPERIAPIPRPPPQKYEPVDDTPLREEVEKYAKEHPEHKVELQKALKEYDKRRFAETNHPINPPVAAQTTSSKPWKIIALAAVILLLLGWVVSRRKRRS